MSWTINFKLLRKAKDLNHCLCDLDITCPCNEFINNKKCRCGVYKKTKHRKMVEEHDRQ